MCACARARARTHTHTHTHTHKRDLTQAVGFGKTSQRKIYLNQILNCECERNGYVGEGRDRNQREQEGRKFRKFNLMKQMVIICVSIHAVQGGDLTVYQYHFGSTNSSNRYSRWLVQKQLFFSLKRYRKFFLALQYRLKSFTASAEIGTTCEFWSTHPHHSEI